MAGRKGIGLARPQQTTNGVSQSQEKFPKYLNGNDPPSVSAAKGLFVHDLPNSTKSFEHHKMPMCILCTAEVFAILMLSGLFMTQRPKLKN